MSATDATTLDPVTLTVIDNALTSTCRDMGVTMMKTSYSPIFNESLDFSCVIFDPEGQMLAQAEFCPSQIGTIKFTVAWTLDELGRDAFEPGDVVIHNDPYRGSGHVPEHMVLKAVFFEGELFGFVANVAHMSEPGAKTPGGLSGDATEVFQEGLGSSRRWSESTDRSAPARRSMPRPENRTARSSVARAPAANCR